LYAVIRQGVATWLLRHDRAILRRSQNPSLLGYWPTYNFYT